MWGKTEPAIPPKVKKEYLHITLKSGATETFALDMELDPNFSIWKHKFLAIDQENGDTVLVDVNDISRMVNCFRPTL